MLDIGLFFPTAIGVQKDLLNKSEISTMIDKTEVIKNNVATSSNLWLSGKDSPYNTIDKYDILEDEDFKPLVDAVNLSVKEFAEYHSDHCEYTPANSWVNIYQKNNLQEPHNHSYPCMYSAVYYLKAPKNSGKIVFLSPFTQYVNEQRLIDNGNFLNDTYRYFVPVDNMLVIFKSHLIHYVLPGDNDEERISIPFNYVSSKLLSIRKIDTSIK